MKIGISSYSYSRLIQSSQIEWIDVVAKSSELGFDAIEFIDLPESDEPTQIAFANQVRETCASFDLPIVNYAVSGDFIHGCGGDMEAEIQNIKRSVRVAAALGSPQMRHDVTRGFTRSTQGPLAFQSVVSKLAEGCRTIAQYAADLGVQTLVENHGYYCQDSERMEQLADAVDHPNFGLLVDIGNFICVDENCAAAVGRLMPFARHIHIKDFHLKPGTHPDPGEGWNRSRGGNHWRGAIIGHGDVPIPQCLALIRQSGYDQTLTIEYEGMEEVLTGIRIGHDNLRKFLEESTTA